MRLPKDENVYFKSPVKITIDGRDYSLPNPVEIRVFNDSKSVSKSIALLSLKDRRSGEERLAGIQRVDGERYPDDLRYRVLFVQPDGSVMEEWFKYAERDEPLYRTVLAQYVHPEPLGFRSQVLSFWPTIFYPVLYPWITGMVGFVLTVFGAVVLLTRYRKVSMAAGLMLFVAATSYAQANNASRVTYPAVWFAPVNDSNKPAWEILPQEAKPGEVILSKRNELGILSNFAATPFEMDGKRYASVEGFWQMMLYPEGPDDERSKDKRVNWKYTRGQVAQMTAFEAKQAGTLAEENMKALGIDWVTYQGKRFPYRSQTPGEHHKLIVAAMRAKLEQNPEVKRILLATGDLILRPDHHGEENPPPEWKYNELWMRLRAELRSA